VLPGGDEDLSSHVAALLGAGLLVLEVDARGAGLDEELDELHNGAEATVAGVAVGDDGDEVVDLRWCSLAGEDGRGAFLILPAVVVELGAHELITLPGHCVHGIIRKVRPGLVGAARRARALPPADVDAAQMGCHLYHLHRIQRAERVAVSPRRVEPREELVELATGGVGIGAFRRRDAVSPGAGGARRTEGRHVRGGVGPPGATPPRPVAPPPLDGGDLVRQRVALGFRVGGGG